VAVKRFSHHFVPHHHVESGRQHRAHLLGVPALFSYALVVSLITSGLFIIHVSAPQILGSITFSADQIITLTNQKRAENGLQALSFNSQLASAAGAKAGNMFAENYWAHNSPSGKTPWSFVSSAGYHYIYAGENLARDFSDAGAVVNAWMNSPSHRENLLDKNFKEIGVAVADGKLDGHDGILVVQMFGSAISQVQTVPLVGASPLPSPVVSPTVVAKATPATNSSQTPTTIVSSPVASPIPSPSPSSQPSPVVVAQAQDVNGVANSSAVVLASRQFSVAKIASIVVVAFIFLLFVLEVLVVSAKSHLKMKSTTWAHLGILGFLLLVVWYAVQGAII
jgi:hypothetical protein